MKRTIVTTQDGSTTIYMPDLEESYHSRHGAIQEAKHVFIKNGLDRIESSDEIKILEIGFGTGLNTFITYLEAINRNLIIDYVGVEAYPISQEEIESLNYVESLDAKNHATIFEKLHQSSWEAKQLLHPHFSFTKRIQRFENINDAHFFDLIYFDAFGFRVQPELWESAIFQKMYDALKPKGILTTYACRTIIKKNMEAAGFSVKKVAGPPGKREMLVAFKGDLR
uniref:tRNA (5-methylaminomethyl-2-thiouridine)(34)-methyltransferase MnmD n=1 Tax=Flavobacterium sp. TaxID=239 RepID=UPI004049EA03